EKMSKGRLKVYDGNKPENIILGKYILHTEESEAFPYEITPDKDSIRTPADREKYVPAVFILTVIRKLMKYCKAKHIENQEELIFETLDLYIQESSNPPHLRKHFFSILGTVIDNAAKADGDLASYILNMIEFDHTEYEDVSKE